MWQAFLGTVRQRDEARVEYQIIYTDGEQKLLREYNTVFLDDATISAAARNEINRLGTLAVKKGPLTLTEGAEIDLTPPPEINPTAEELLRRAWLDRYNLHRRQQQWLDLGIIAEDDPSLVDVAQLKKDMLPEYFNFI